MTVTASPGTGSVIVDVATMPNQVITTATSTQVFVSGTTGLALAANANRLWALFMNDSDAAIYLKLGATATINNGIRLNANGGSFEMSAALGNLYRGAINAITTTGTKTLAVTEGV